MRASCIAARVSGVTLELSIVGEESDEALAQRLAGATHATRLRLLAPASDALRRAAFEAGVAVDTAPVVAVPAIELQHWVLEQSVSRTMHRHGRLISD